MGEGPGSVHSGITPPQANQGLGRGVFLAYVVQGQVLAAAWPLPWGGCWG